MPVPTHSRDCITKTYKTICPYCNSKVFFFSCNCGSKIFFDEIGDPWPQHLCKESKIKYEIDFIRISKLMKDSEIIKLIEDHSKESGKRLSDETWDLIESELGKRKKPFNFTEIDCESDIEGFSGVIIEINKQINFYKRLGLDKAAPYSFQFLGEFKNGVFSEIIIRDKADNNNLSRQITCYIEEKIIKGNYIKISDMITVRLRKSKSIEPLWVISFLQKI